MVEKTDQTSYQKDWAAANVFTINDKTSVYGNNTTIISTNGNKLSPTAPKQSILDGILFFDKTDHKAIVEM
jgi:hypothetical protein